MFGKDRIAPPADNNELAYPHLQSFEACGPIDDFAAALSWRHKLRDDFLYAEAVELAHLERELFSPQSPHLDEARHGTPLGFAELLQNEAKFGQRVRVLGPHAVQTELAIFNRLNAQFIAIAHEPDLGPKGPFESLDPLYALRVKLSAGGLGDLGGRFRESFANCPDLLWRRRHLPK